MNLVAPTRVHRGLAQHTIRAGDALSRAPWWVQALLVWLASRLWAGVIFAVVDRQAPTGPWGPTPLGYFNFMTIWDGQWYQSVHDAGYPAELPRDAAGTVQPNAWAFFPVFPLLVRGITAFTGLPWAVTASTVALLAGFGAAVLILKLFRDILPNGAALWALAVVAFGPASPVFQTAYAESLHLAMLAGVLLLVLRGQVLWSVGLILLMCLTRPAGVPFAAALGLTWLIHAVGHLGRARAAGTLQVGTVPAVFNKWFWLAVWACVCAMLWPAFAWAVTGEIGAYTDTETAWRGSSLLVFEPWLALGNRFFGPALGWLAVLVVIVVFFLLITTRVVRQTLPLVVWMWVACYAVYLLAFLHPQSSTFRMLIPLFVLAAPLVAASPSRSYRITLVVVGALFQIVWIGYLWQWSPLPGGGDWPP
ncbi:hypothetical protein [Kocuria sp.]|uniref:hypothetical protein n=1 Tax=Kocuria sp. TaxID=1871328 RepID=UPI0026E0F003|nr:hypothetical protein [Kocuria sp.]MDO5617181.1 hypothetical protein [Kocuria sp.]